MIVLHSTQRNLQVHIGMSRKEVCLRMLGASPLHHASDQIAKWITLSVLRAIRLCFDCNGAGSYVEP